MKKIVYTWFLFTGISIALPAQQFSPFENIQSSSQQLIADAIKEGVFIIHRYYQLQDTTAQTPIYFGWQNQNWFGETYSLGIKTKEGYYLMDQAVRPWMYDKKFEQYAQSDRLVPVISTSEYKMPEDTSYTALPYSNVIVKEIYTHQLYLAQDTTTFHQKGFSMDLCEGAKKGWLVWLVVNNSLEQDNSQTLSFLIYRLELTFEQGKGRYQIATPSTNKHIVGGFYLLPEITDIGQITFYLTGMLQREEGTWQVVHLNDAAYINEDELQTISTGLTPINTDISNDNYELSRDGSSDLTRNSTST